MYIFDISDLHLSFTNIHPKSITQFYTYVLCLVQAFAFFTMVAFGALAGLMVYLLITQNINKSRSSDPSSNYKEEAAEPDYKE